MSRKANPGYIIDTPDVYYKKQFIYKGWKIGLIQISASGTGGLYLFDEYGRFHMHAQLKNGAAWTIETELMAEDTVDQMIAGTFPPTACE